MDIFGILAMVGGLALFLYGMQVLGDGLKRTSGGRLEEILESLTSNKWKGALLGCIVTAVIQSSSATTVMVVGLVNSGIMKLTQAAGVILGANVGTTVTSWMLSLTGIESSNVFVQLLKPANFSPIVGIIGVIMLMTAKNDKKVGRGRSACSSHPRTRRGTGGCSTAGKHHQYPNRSRRLFPPANSDIDVETLPHRRCAP